MSDRRIIDVFLGNWISMKLEGYVSIKEFSDMFGKMLVENSDKDLYLDFYTDIDQYTDEKILDIDLYERRHENDDEYQTRLKREMKKSEDDEKLQKHILETRKKLYLELKKEFEE